MLATFLVLLAVVALTLMAPTTTSAASATMAVTQPVITDIPSVQGSGGALINDVSNWPLGFEWGIIGLTTATGFGLATRRRRTDKHADKRLSEHTGPAGTTAGRHSTLDRTIIKDGATQRA